MVTVSIGIVGDFDREKRSHWATEAALFHAAARLGVAVAPQWIPTTAVAGPDCARILKEFDGIGIAHTLMVCEPS